MDLIIGAGVSGISYAGFTSNNYLVIEKEDEVGGYCRTIKKKGFVWDYSGHFFHFRYPELKDRVCKYIDKNKLLNVKKHTQILYNNQYIDFPFQKNIHQLNKEEFIDCLYDLFNSNDDESYESFEDMIIKKYGKSIADKFLIPYNEKLYACNLNKLDVNAMGRFFPKADKNDIISNFRNNNNMSYNDSFEYPTEGAVEYVNSLMKYVNQDCVSLNEELIYIDIENKKAKTNLREISYDNLISTIPFPLLLSKCNIPFECDIFTCNKVLVFNLGFDSKGNDKLNSWIYIPDRKYIFYRVGYYDNIMNSDSMSLYVEIGFPSTEKIQDPTSYLDAVMQDLRTCGIVCTQKLIAYEAIVMDPAYVHINKNSTRQVQHFKEILKEYDIYSIGRYGSWTYCSIEDNINEAYLLSENIKC